MARKLSRRPHTLWVSFPSGAIKRLDSASEREARTRILYCLADNTGMSRQDANAHADAVEIGVRYTAAPFFAFELTLTEGAENV